MDDGGLGLQMTEVASSPTEINEHYQRYPLSKTR